MGKLKNQITADGLVQIGYTSLNDLLCCGNKESKMNDLCFEIVDTMNGQIVASRKYRCLKRCVGGIKRSTQPTTERNILASAAFLRSRLFFELIHTEKYHIVLSIGIQKNKNVKTEKNKKKSDCIRCCTLVVSLLLFSRNY